MKPAAKLGSPETQASRSSSDIRPRKRPRIDTDSERVDVNILAAEPERQTYVDLGKGFISSVLTDEHDDGPKIWDALHTSQIDDPLKTSEVTSPVFPDTFSRARDLKSSFPSLEEALRLCDVAFRTCYRLHETIRQEDFHRDVAILYDTSQEEDGFLYLDQCTLLAAVIGLAYALDAESHNAIGCGHALSQGLYYIRFAHTHLQVAEGSVATVTQLRTVVSVVLFQLITNNAWSALPYLSVACNTTLHVGLHAHFSADTSDEDTPMQNLYWTVLYLDAYVCGLLGQKPFFDLSGAKKSTLKVMQHVASNTSKIVRSSKELLFNVGLALSIELFDIQKRIADLPLQNVSSKQARDATITDIRALEIELDDFKAVCDAIFLPGEVVNVVARTRFELIMGFCITSLMLAMQRRRFMTATRLAFIPGSDGASTKRYSRDTAAILAIDTASEYIKLPEHAPFSEPAAYALFVCTLCLTAVMSTTTAAKDRLRIATKVLEGFFLMTRIACPRFAGTPVYLHYIYKLGNECGAIPSTGEDIDHGPPVASPIAAEKIPQPELNFDIDWTSLPDDLQVDGGLLQTPNLHDVPQVPVFFIPEPSAPSQQSTSAATSQGFSQPMFAAIPASYQTSQSSAPPSLFSHQSSSASESTPSSSARMTPLDDGRRSSSRQYSLPASVDQKGKKSLAGAGTIFNREGSGKK